MQLAHLALLRRFFAETKSQPIQLGLVATEALLSSVLVTVVPWSVGAFIEEVVLEKSPAYDVTTIALVLLAAALLFLFRFVSRVLVRRAARSNALLARHRFQTQLKRKTKFALDPEFENDLTRILAFPLAGLAPVLRFAVTLLGLTVLAVSINQHILFEPFTTTGGITLAFFYVTLMASYTRALPDAFLAIELAGESVAHLYDFLDKPVPDITRELPTSIEPRKSPREFENELR